jgi:DNA-binding response OmpR family regulator
MDRKKNLILIVDDNEVILKTLSMKLKAHDYDVQTALDGSQALRAVRNQKPDLILLDINFPADVGHGGGVPWDGFLMIKWFNRMEEAKNTPVIIITGGDAAQFKDQALAAGAAAFFHKPIDNDELLATIHKLVDGHQKETNTADSSLADQI